MNEQYTPRSTIWIEQGRTRGAGRQTEEPEVMQLLWTDDSRLNKLHGEAPAYALFVEVARRDSRRAGHGRVDIRRMWFDPMATVQHSIMAANPWTVFSLSEDFVAGSFDYGTGAFELRGPVELHEMGMLQAMVMRLMVLAS